MASGSASKVSADTDGGKTMSSTSLAVNTVPSPTGSVAEGYSSLEDDAPTRVITKRATFSQDTAPQLIRATTKEREKSNDQRRLPSYYVRDFGDKISPGYEDVLRQAGWRTDSEPITAYAQPSAGENDNEKVTSMDIMHNWTQEVRDEEFIATISIFKKGSSSATEPEGRILWIHVEDPLPSLKRLERFFKSHLARRVQPFVSETTMSLLNRVKINRERKLVSGSMGRFLIPGIVRYSARSSATGNEDHPCLFLSFPYLALGTFNGVSSVHPGMQAGHSSQAKDQIQIRARNQNLSQRSGTQIANGNTGSDPERGQRQGLSRKNPLIPQTLQQYPVNSSRREREILCHPPRTLLQSRYRLESTKKRDQFQAILTLTPKQVRECISRPSQATTISQVPSNSINQTAVRTNDSNPRTQSSHRAAVPKVKSKREKVYIPQLWSLSLSGDVMLTCGPISLNDLCSSALVRKDFRPEASKLKHSLVRFIIENENGQDDIFNYPAEQCEWFYGLINKQRKVENTLGKQKKTQNKAKQEPSTKLRYTLVYRKEKADAGCVVDCNNWLVIQSEHDGPQLDLFMENQNIPPVSISGPSPSQFSDSSTQPKSSPQRINSHRRAVSDPASPRSPTSPRFLMIATPQDQRGRSGSSSARSASPISSTGPAMPEDYTTFFEWPFLEEVTGNVKEENRTNPDQRVRVWLAKTLNGIYRSHGHSMDAALRPSNKSVPFQKPSRLTEVIHGSYLGRVDEKFLGSTAPDIVRDPTSVISKEVQKIFRLCKGILKSFVPEFWVKLEPSPDNLEAGKTIHTYWGLVERLLDGVVDRRLEESDLQVLSQRLDCFHALVKRTHQGVWKMKGDKTSPEQIETVNSAVIYMPLASAFEHICDLLFEAIYYMSNSTNTPNLATGAFQLAIERSNSNVLQDFDQTQRFLIQEGDESRYQKSLGPVVTPEGITILLLRRLSRGVYRDGTLNLIEVYERVVEQLSTKVEDDASRFLLLEINRVAEEIDVILETFHNQKSFLNTYRDYLDPDVIENSSIKRKSRFEYEQHNIERISNELDERIKDCSELKEHIQRLATQNLQIVEGGQDDINNKLKLFTFFTIIFLPPSFVTSFFGMNLKGIVDTDHRTALFWIVATPLTIVLLIISLAIMYQTKLSSYWKKMLATWRTEELDED